MREAGRRAVRGRRGALRLPVGARLPARLLPAGGRGANAGRGRADRAPRPRRRRRCARTSCGGSRCAIRCGCRPGSTGRTSASRSRGRAAHEKRALLARGAAAATTRCRRSSTRARARARRRSRQSSRRRSARRPWRTTRGSTASARAEVQRRFLADDVRVIVRDERVRHGRRQAERADRRARERAGVARGVLPGGRARGPRRRAGAGAAARREPRQGAPRPLHQARGARPGAAGLAGRPALAAGRRRRPLLARRLGARRAACGGDGERLRALARAPDSRRSASRRRRRRPTGSPGASRGASTAAPRRCAAPRSRRPRGPAGASTARSGRTSRRRVPARARSCATSATRRHRSRSSSAATSATPALRARRRRRPTRSRSRTSTTRSSRWRGGARPAVGPHDLRRDPARLAQQEDPAQLVRRAAGVRRLVAHAACRHPRARRRADRGRAGSRRPTARIRCCASPACSRGVSFRIAVLVSGEGSNLQALLDDGRTGATIEIVGVASSRADARGLARAETAGHRDRRLLARRRAGPRRARRGARATGSRSAASELVVLAGFMELLTPGFIRRFAGRIVNVHPALLPAFPGLGAIEQALEHGVKVAGVTVHFVDEGVDSGPIVLQEAVRASLPSRHRGDRAALPRRRAPAAAARRAADRGGSRVARPGQPAARARGVGWLRHEPPAAETVAPGRGAHQARAPQRVGQARARGVRARARPSSAWRSSPPAARRASSPRQGIETRPVEDYTGFPEILDGRVKTLNPRIYAGLLAVRSDDEHMETLDEHDGRADRPGVREPLSVRARVGGSAASRTPR